MKLRRTTCPRITLNRRVWLGCWLAVSYGLAATLAAAEDGQVLDLRFRTRVAVAPDSDRYREVTVPTQWKAKQTAIVICDMWNNHYCRNAARRVAEMAPRMNEVIKRAREKGVLIIHSPSGCMDRYAGTPQRQRAQAAPAFATKIPLQGWCHLNDQREGPLPIAIDQPCDDDGATRPAVKFFDRQIETLEIAPEDAITDSAEAFYLMKERGITNVIIMGVHTNMCVLGRPFGIRQLVYQGQNVVLMRDMTDTMYNPRNEPYVDHFTGNDLVFEHIERYWCPTITSADFLGGEPFRFPGDKRPHLVVVMAEEGYRTDQTLPAFALRQLGADFKLSYVYANSDNPHDLPGLDILDSADIAIWSIRRRTLPESQLNVFRRYLAAGKPLIALRTTSHGFATKSGDVEAGLAAWPQFDQEVLGHQYQGDHNNQTPTRIQAAEGVAGHPILHGVRSEFLAASSLYRTQPLVDTTAVLLWGKAEGIEQAEPVAWTHQRPNAGRIFYTSLGHPDDFAAPDVPRLLRNAVYWAANLPIPSPVDSPPTESPTR